MRKIYGLQYLRALAALAVAVFHSTADQKGPTFSIGNAGVDLFFVLSGFLMIAITDQDSRPISFLADRIRRIVPIYWIATTVMLVSVLLGHPPLPHDLGHLAASYLFVPWRYPGSQEVWPILIQGWTLNFEMAFYLVFAALLPVGSQQRQVGILTLLFATLVTAGIVLHAKSAIAITYASPMLLEFVAGCWLGLAWKAGRAWPRGLVAGSAVLAALIVLLINVSGVHFHRAVAFGLPAALMLLTVLAIERRYPIPKWRLPLLLGDASYSIYLWHGFGILAAASLCSRLGLPRDLSILVRFVSGVGVGLGAYFALERPILTYFRERRYIKGVPVPPGP